jgi:hypothetical protein
MANEAHRQRVCPAYDAKIREASLVFTASRLSLSNKVTLFSRLVLPSFRWMCV